MNEHFIIWWWLISCLRLRFDRFRFITQKWYLTAWCSALWCDEPTIPRASTPAYTVSICPSSVLAWRSRVAVLYVVCRGPSEPERSAVFYLAFTGAFSYSRLGTGIGITTTIRWASSWSERVSTQSINSRTWTCLCMIGIDRYVYLHTTYNILAGSDQLLY